MSRSSDAAAVAPGPIGRGGRIAFGVLLGLYGTRVLWGWIAAWAGGGLRVDEHVYSGFVQRGNLALYALALVCVYFLPWGRRGVRLAVFAGVAFVAAAVGWWLWGDWWGLPLALWLSGIVIVTAVFFAVAHILAGMVAQPG